MTILTAKVAGVRHVIGCTPPINGKLPDATITAMHLAGADEIFIVGGVQAIAAMAVGTETIRKVDFLAGPGNAFVAEGKRQLFGEVGIDLFAGPTEVLIVADEHADPYTVATDLLSQAEHGPDTPAILITNSEELARSTIEYVDKLLLNLPTAGLAGTSWRDFGEVAVVGDLNEAYALADAYASEHVQILTQNPREALEKMQHFGAIFLGERTCVSYGDKVRCSSSFGNQTSNSRLTPIFSVSARITFSLLERQLGTREVFGLVNFSALSPTKRLDQLRPVANLDDCVDVQPAQRALKGMLDQVTYVPTSS